MTSKIDAPIHTAECGRPACRLRVVEQSGAEECLMESVRPKWSDPSAENYCKDPASRKFVDLMHAKSESAGQTE